MNSAIYKQHAIREIIGEIARTGEYLWQKGWAERNAGNISVNLTHHASHIAHRLFENPSPVPLDQSYPLLAGDILVMTRTGSRMRDLARDPQKNLCFLRIGPEGKSCSGLCDGDGSSPEPTSELPTHLAIHSFLKEKKTGYTAIVHTHATELIALTQIPEFRDETDLNRLLLTMHPETKLFVPQGIGVVPFMEPGTAVIAQATAESLKGHDVVAWEKHGVLSVGRSVTEAFDLIDILAKAATIFFTCRNAGFDPEGLPSVNK